MTELVTVKSHNRVADCICKSETRIDKEQSSHVIGSARGEGNRLFYLLLWDSSSQPSSLKADALTIVLQDPCLWIILPSLSLSLSISLSLSWLQGAGGLGCACKKKHVLKPLICFFACPLLNLPTPPRYLV